MGVKKYRNGFRLTIHKDALDEPLHWRRPRMIFVNSMSDLFHEKLSFAFIHRCFQLMEKANIHIYQVLTKRPERMLEYSRLYEKIADHIWMGATVESPVYKRRIDLLRKVDASTRFVSFEPLLGSLGELDLTEISWAIVGGESGPNHRPVDGEWIREIRDQCIEQNVSFFFKQWGGPTPRSGGRILDGRTWDEYPGSRTPFEPLLTSTTQ